MPKTMPTIRDQQAAATGADITDCIVQEQVQARLNEIVKRVNDQLERKRMISLFFTNIFHALVQFGFTCYLAGKGSTGTIGLL